jgi:hypothetical protein
LDSFVSQNKATRARWRVFLLVFLLKAGYTVSKPQATPRLEPGDLAWRDPAGCSLAHAACWGGNIGLIRALAGDTKVGGL